MPETRVIAALAYPGLQLLDVVGPLETFNLASQQRIDDGAAKSLSYKVVVVSRGGMAETSMSGLSINAQRSLDDGAEGIDTLLVPGALTGGSKFYEDAEYVRFVQQAAGDVRRLCSVCSGALLLAAAGVLDGKRATTHWMDAAELRESFPDVRVEENRIYLQDGNVYSSGGITAGIDLALALVEQDFSRRLALKVAKRLLVFLKRPGDQQQFSTFLSAQSHPTRFMELLDWITDNLDQSISTRVLASRACMSERSFRRHFESEVGMPVQRYLARARITKAQSMLETSTLPIVTVANRCGFRSADAMRYAFATELDVTPSEYRRRFGESANPDQ